MRTHSVIGDAGRPLQSKPRPSGDAHTPGQSGHPTGTRTRGSRLILERARPIGSPRGSKHPDPADARLTCAGRSAPRPPQCPRPSHAVRPGSWGPLGDTQAGPGRHSLSGSASAPWGRRRGLRRVRVSRAAASQGCSVCARARCASVRAAAPGSFVSAFACWEGACALPAAPRPPGTLGSVVPGSASAARADVVRSPVGDSCDQAAAAPCSRSAEQGPESAKNRDSR